MAHSSSDDYCDETVRTTLDLIGSKWAMRILWELLTGERRYAELQRRVGGISQKVLSAELKSLVIGGLVEREVTPTVPPQVTYRVTTVGRSLDAIIGALDQWGRQNNTAVSPAQVAS